MGITPKDPAHFDPAMGNYTDLKPFRFWCQKVLPLVYDDSLSYYEVLCKVVDYLNKAMEDVGVLHDDVDNLNTAYLQLQNYVNTYFSTLDVQQEINNKLDTMAEDGTLDALLLPYFNAYKTEINGIVANQNTTISNFQNQVSQDVTAQNQRINAQDQSIATLIGRMDSFVNLPQGSTTGDAELQDIRVGANGITYPTAGDAVRGQYNQLNNVDTDSSKVSGLFTKKANYENTQWQKIPLGALDTSKTYYIKVDSVSDSTNLTNIYIDDSGTAVVSSITIDNRYEFTPVNGSSVYLILRYSTIPSTTPYATYEFGEVGSTLFDKLLPTLDGIKVTNSYIKSQFPVDWKDCNNLPINTVIGVKFGWTASDGFSNYPLEGFQGEVLTINTTKDNSTHGFQLAIVERSNDNETQMFYRRRYLSWGGWKPISVSGDNIMIDPYGYSINSYPEEWKNCNNLPINKVVGIKFNWHNNDGFSNYPVENFQGEILTINTVLSNATHGFQIAMMEKYYDSDTKIYYRRRYTKWGEWKSVGSSGLSQFIGTGAFRGLGSFTLCGDSLSVSLAYKDSSHSKTVKSWGRILADMMSVECNVYAQGGYATGNFLNSVLYTQAVNDIKDFAIIYLGTNDANNNVSESAFKQNYINIINGLLTNHKYVLCLNLPPATSGSNRGNYNTWISEVCSSYDNAFVVDIAKYNDDFALLRGWGHLSSVGYSAFAQSVSKAIDELIGANDYFKIDVDF